MVRDGCVHLAEVHVCACACMQTWCECGSRINCTRGHIIIISPSSLLTCPRMPDKNLPIGSRIVESRDACASSTPLFTRSSSVGAWGGGSVRHVGDV